MKLEEVLPHLRAGGKVKYKYGKIFCITNSLTNVLKSDPKDLAGNEFEIVKEPYKKEIIIHKESFNRYFIDGDSPDTTIRNLPKGDYKVTIEEIE